MNKEKRWKIKSGWKKSLTASIILLGILFGLLLTYRYFVAPYNNREKPILVNTKDLREDVFFHSSDDSIKQSFSLKDCHIKKIALWINASKLENKTNISVSLKNLDTGHVVETWKREISSEHGDGGIEFELENPLEVVEETSFQIELTIESIDHSEEFAVKCTDWNSYPLGNMTINDIEQEKEMVFWIYDNPTTMIKYLFGFIAGIIIFGYILLVYVIYKNKNIKEETLFLIIGSLLGILYLVFWSPYAAPDENRHFATAYYYSNILLGEEPLSEDGQVMMRAEDLKYNNQEEFTRLSTYSLIVDNLFEITDDNQMVESGEGVLGVPWVPYTLQIIGITIARVCNLSCVGLLFLGRSLSLIFYLIIGWISLRILPVCKKILFVILLFPGTIEMGASFSYDNMLNCMLFLYFSYLMYIKYQKKSMDFRAWLFVSVMMCIAVPIKIVYIFMTLLCFIVIEDWKKIKNKVIVLVPFISCCLITLIQRITVINSFVSGERASEAADRWTIGLVLEHPFKCVQMALRTILTESGRWIKELIWGFPEYSDISFSEILPWLFILILLIVAFDNSEKRFFTKKEKISVLLISGCICALIMCVFLLAELTYTYSAIIGGIQGRYFLPLLPWIVFLIRNHENVNIDIRKYRYIIPVSIFLLNTRFIMEVFLSVITR